MHYAKTLTLIIGFTGQFLFFMRFLLQWIKSEQEQRSVIPELFWYLSLGGGIFLLVYAVLRGDIVFIIGQSTGTFIYLRNIWFLRKERRQQQVAYAE